MIQASQPKPIETKAPRSAEALEAVSKTKNLKGASPASVSSNSEDSEFAAELETKLKTGEVDLKALEAEVKPVQIAEEQILELPTTFIQPTGTVETTSPKVFDPSVTKDVQKLIQPQTSEVKGQALTDAQVLELAQGNVEMPVPAEDTLKAQFAKSLENAPKLADASGRSPAIDFGKTEIDPQLLNNEDFVAQKNLAMNKKVVTNAYGMKQVPAQQQKVALENGLQPTQVVKEAATENPSMNSQQFILNLSTEPTNNMKANETQVAPKVFDMNNVKSSNPTEVMNQITDYVVQAKAAKEPTVNMRMKHDDLGMIDITVSKVAQGQDAIAINIGTHSADGKTFFQQNSKDLFSHLTNAGLNVSDLKVETPPQTAKNDFDFGSQSGRNQHGSEKQFGSEQNQRRHDSDKRQDLWKLLNKEAA